jgi:hypothetical protein
MKDLLKFTRRNSGSWPISLRVDGTIERTIGNNSSTSAIVYQIDSQNPELGRPIFNLQSSILTHPNQNQKSNRLARSSTIDDSEEWHGKPGNLAPKMKGMIAEGTKSPVSKAKANEPQLDVGNSK